VVDIVYVAVYLGVPVWTPPPVQEESRGKRCA